MNSELYILFGLFAAVFALLLWGRWRYDIVAFAALIVGVLAGAVPVEGAFSGFGHPATVIVAMVLVVSRGLVNSGVVHLITRRFVDTSRGVAGHIVVIGGIGALLSAFMNNVAALALLMPVDVQTAKKAGRSAGLTLMPLSFATILGGLVTLIGTPPNIIIASFRGAALGEPYRMFDFAPVGGLCALAGLAFVATIGWRLIPRREGEGPSEKLFELTDYIAEVVVPEESPAVGKRVRELDEEADQADVAVIGLVRDGHRLYGTARNAEIRAGDSLVVEAAPDSLDEFRDALKLAFAGDAEREREPAGEGFSLIEVVVPEPARIVGRSAHAVGLLPRQNATLLGISRRGRRIRERVRRTPIEPGDILLLLAPTDRVAEIANWLGALPLAERGFTVTQSGKTWLAIAVFALAVAAASFGLVPLAVGLGAVAVLYVVSRVVPARELYDSIQWPVVVLLGSMIPLGAALEQAGGTRLIAEALVGVTAGLPGWAILALLMVVTMTLSDVLNNAATAIVAAPIAIDVSRVLGVAPDPFLMGVAVAASCAFLTPIGHQNNSLVLGPGGYAFGDYWRMGLPLEMIIIAVAVPAILVVWPM